MGNKLITSFLAVWLLVCNPFLMVESKGKVKEKPAVKQKDSNDTNQIGKNDKDTKTKFVASKKGKVFHKPECKAAARISADNLVSYATREEAIAAGKKPCKVCNP